MKFFLDKNYKEAKNNVFFKRSYSKRSLRWFFRIFIFRLWLILNEVKKREFSQEKKDLDDALIDIPFGGDTLDIGGGSGSMSTYWNAGKEDRFIVLDPVFRKTILDQQAYQKRKLIYVQGVGEEVPFQEKSFDTVIISAAIDWADQSEKVISEAHRILKKRGGLLFVQKINNYKLSFKYGHMRDFNEADVLRLLSGKFEILKNKLSSNREVMYIWAVKTGA